MCDGGSTCAAVGEMKCLSGLGEQVCHAGNTLGRSGWCSEDGWLDALLVSEDLPKENRVTVHGPCREIVAIDSYENEVHTIRNMPFH